MKLDNLIAIYDSNDITIDGDLSLTMSEDVGKRFEAYNWYVQNVNDVNDLEKLSTAIANAINYKGKPSVNNF